MKPTSEHTLNFIDGLLIISKTSACENCTLSVEALIKSNLVILLEYAEGTFSVIKNRWGYSDLVQIPLRYLPLFLLNPHARNMSELNDTLSTTNPEQDNE